MQMPSGLQWFTPVRCATAQQEADSSRPDRKRGPQV